MTATNKHDAPATLVSLSGDVGDKPADIDLVAGRLRWSQAPVRPAISIHNGGPGNGGSGNGGSGSHKKSEDRKGASPNSCPPTEPSARGATSGVRTSASVVLVVEDDAETLELVETYFRSIGFATRGAASGAEAIRVLQEGALDIVLLDVVMPDMSGREVLSEIRSRYDATELPVIMTTALGSSQDVVRSLRLGANDYVTKPLELEVVAARVATQLRLKRTRDGIHELHRGLATAQDRIAALAARTSSPGCRDFAALADGIAREAQRAISGSRVIAWLLDSGQIVAASEDDASRLPTAAELKAMSNHALISRASDLLLGFTDELGDVLGAMSVQRTERPFSDTEQEAIASFARHLGSIIQLGEMRGDPFLGPYAATERELITTGAGLLQLCPTCSRCYSQVSRRCQADGSSLQQAPGPLPFRLAQRYRLIQRVGQGGMGIVFRARDERLQRDVALKLLKHEYLRESDIRQRFTAEAKFNASLGHPSIVSIHDYGVAQGSVPFIVFEWLDGTDLSVLLREQGPGSPAQVAELLLQVGDAVEYAHNAGLIHRDIKPANIFINYVDGRLRTSILDFGVAKEVVGDLSVTQPGSMVGTPLYMAPEQLLDGKVDRRSDVYSLAAVAFEALTGLPPRPNHRISQLFTSSDRAAAPILGQHIEGVSKELDAAFSAALTLNPEQRIASAAAWVSLIHDQLAALPQRRGWRFE